MKTKWKSVLRGSVLASLCASLVLLAGPQRSGRADPGDNKSTVGGNGPIDDEMNDETRRSIKKGLDWLSKNLTAEGGINSVGGDSAAIVGVGGLGFLGRG